MHILNSKQILRAGAFLGAGTVFLFLFHLFLADQQSSMSLLLPFFTLGGSGGGGGGAGGGGASCPFLTVWNGKKYKYENDILFSKPASLFDTFKKGMAAYEKGLSGDTYFFSQEPHVENNEIRFQIREIEPEQSYVDQITLSAVELPRDSVPLVNTSLDTYHVFDTNISKPEQSSYVHSAKNGRTRVFRPVTETLSSSARPEEGTLLMKDDELLLSVDSTHLNTNKPLYLVVESYYRDWTLGEQIPFSLTEKAFFQSAVFSRQTVTPIVMAGLLAVGVGTTDRTSTDPVPEDIQSFFTIPHASADDTTGDDGKSLIVSTQDETSLTHIATIFPRHLTPTKEIVEIPRSALTQTRTGTCTLRIRATKTHKVTGAFVFQGNERSIQETPLKTTKAFHRRLNTDLSDTVSRKDSQMMSLLPGDIVDVSVRQNKKATPGHRLAYVLRAHGFYTPLEDRTHNSNWYRSLDRASKKILRGLRSVAYPNDLT